MRAAVLVIAGTDSSGGAGLSRDVQTLHALNVEVLCAVTAVTAQTYSQVHAVQCMTATLVEQQIRTAFATRPIQSVKIGMLGNAAIVEAVVNTLRDHPGVPVVLDPVILSTSGGQLLDEQGVQAMLTDLLPLTTLITPNLPELAALTAGSSDSDDATLVARARQLLERGARAVLVKGGHAQESESIDLLVLPDQVHRFVAQRLTTQRRGTGCMLASGIAGFIAQGLSLPEACEKAKQQVLEYLKKL